MTDKIESNNYKNWILTDRQICDLELIIDGSFKPLSGFLNEGDYNNVLDNYKPIIKFQDLLYFTSYNRAERFIDFIFGEEFQTNEQYITEIIYNNSKLPVSYRIKSTQNDYIGHMTLNYDTNDNLIREAWFQNKKKIKEFVK